MKKIKLTQGRFAIVDDEDFEFLNRQKWYLSGHNYAVSSSLPRVYMHRLINKTPMGMETDHVNRDKLNNRKINLRSVTRSQNSINKGKQKNNTSGFVGVTWFKRDNTWKAQIKLNNKNMHLGYFKNILDAVIARKQAELIYHSI